MLPRGPPQRPIHKQTHRTQGKRLTHSTAPHPVQHTYTMHCATAPCVSAASLKHARHAHARVKRETHHTRCTQAAFLKSSTSPTVLPGAPLREVVSLEEAAVLPRGPPQRPIHKQTHRTQEKHLTNSTAPHPVQHTYTMHCATARCVSAASLKHARHAHARVKRETHHTRCTQAAFLKWFSAHCPLPSLFVSLLACRPFSVTSFRTGLGALFSSVTSLRSLVV